MKKAVPVRMPEWPEAHFPTTKQLRTYLLFWEHHRKPLEPDPGAGLYQMSFWLDPEDLDVDAYEAECFRGERPDRALFIRRIIATYHKGTPAPLLVSKVVTTSRQNRIANLPCNNLDTATSLAGHIHSSRLSSKGTQPS
jgi:hypothetical protein